jgi:hypothetical protein
LAPVVLLLSILVATGSAEAGAGEGFFYAKGPKAIPDGHRSAKLTFSTVLPGDVDPVIDYVSLSIRVNHPQTRDLLVRLKRPDYPYMGSSQSDIPRVVTLSARNTHGQNLGKGTCPDLNPGFAPPGFTTFNDSGGPPFPTSPSPSPPLSSGSPPYPGTFAPAVPLNHFEGYHAAPSTDPASPETWTLIAKDVRDGHSGKLLCAELYLHRF